MATSSEQLLNRRNTVAFILARPVDVVLIPRTLVKTGTGTKYVDQTAREAQEVRLIDQSFNRGGTPGTLIAGDGKQRKIEFQMLMRWDAEVGLYDWFTHLGERWEVAEVLPENGYERRAQVIRFGG